jgi:glycosyltransferase involved in cell wall biosynthesis
MLASIVIRTYNEERYLNELLQAISVQKNDVVDREVVIIDSGSTDATLEIAKSHNCRITHIKKSEFTFGRSLNMGCEFANGDFFVFVSGHCIPASESWLDELCKPMVDGIADYSYGKQIGRDTTKYSEDRHFEKWFPDYSKIPQEGFFCNNANAAVTRSAWELFKFNEDLTGLEDMYLAKLLVESGRKVAYVATAPVYHIHDETWKQVKIRYEREAYALQRIMPEVYFSFSDFVRYFISGVMADSASAIRDKVFIKKCGEIIMFRFNHYWGTYKGNHEHRKLSTKMKKQYFYPLDTERDSNYD